MRHVVASVTFLLGFMGAAVVRADKDTVAMRLIPFDSMTVSNRALVRGVTDHYTLRREYTSQEFKGHVVVFEYLLDHMNVCSALAQNLGLISYRATRRADGRVYADDHKGSMGYVLNVYESNGMRIFYIEGTQSGLFTVHGRGVAVVNYHQKTPDAIEYTGAVFVRVDNVVLAALAQLFSVFLRGTVDGHFIHLIRNPVKLSERAQTDPGKLLGEIAQMSTADQELLTPFTALLQSSTNALPATVNQVN